MKKLIIALAFMMCLFNFPAAGFSQLQISPVHKEASPAAKFKRLTGRVESVSLADPARGTRSEIVVMDKDNNRNAFIVMTTATLYDVNWKAITLDKINKDQTVRVKYTTTKEGVNEATSVNVLKK